MSFINHCEACGIEWVSVSPYPLCARCMKITQPTPPNPLKDAPPLPSAEIESIKVMMLMGGVWSES